MLKAVVFDDEYIVLQGLQSMIDWNRFGIELAGTATDGHSALSLLRSVRPDIVLTDIRMPGLDGLQIVEEVMREAPDTVCVMFSGFNEFEYVKRALHLGVADYLEKPITVPGIEKALRKAAGQIRKRKDNEQLLLEKATMDLLAGGDAGSDWKAGFGAEADRITDTTVLAAAGDFSFSGFDDCKVVCVRNGDEKTVVVYHFGPPSRAFWERLEHDAEQAGIAVGCGRTYPGLGRVSESSKEAQKALRSARFLNMKGLLRFEELGDLITAPKGLSEREEAIILSMRAGNKAGLLDQIDRFIAWIQTEKLDAEVAEREMLKLIYLALESAKETMGAESGHSPFGEDYMPHIQIREMASKGMMTKWFREQIERIADATMEKREHTKHAAVERARIFIGENLSRDLSLQEAAEHVGLNAAYLSVLFKEVTGETYIKFVTRCRMEMARQLLAKGLKVNEVSEKVGYHAYRHFSEVFKKYYGQTPGQYKDHPQTHPKKSDANL